MFTILFSGTDCDGMPRTTRTREVFYSQAVAEHFAWVQNDWSDGISYYVVPISQVDPVEYSAVNFTYHPF